MPCEFFFSFLPFSYAKEVVVLNNVLLTTYRLPFSKYMQRCIDLAMATGWTKQALGRAHLYLSQLYRRHGASLVEAEVLEAKAMETLAENREHVSGWVARLNQPTIRFDDLQPTDQGRYAGTMLLRALWARRNGDKTVTILSPFTGEEITLDTGL